LTDERLADIGEIFQAQGGWKYRLLDGTESERTYRKRNIAGRAMTDTWAAHNKTSAGLIGSWAQGSSQRHTAERRCWNLQAWCSVTWGKDMSLVMWALAHGRYNEHVRAVAKRVLAGMEQATPRP